MFRQANETILLVEDGEAEVLLIQQAVAGCPVELHLAVTRDATEALEWERHRCTRLRDVAPDPAGFETAQAGRTGRVAYLAQ